MKTKISRIPALSLAVAAMLAVLNAQLSTAHAQGTAFTYQGRLNSGGAAATGVYDFRFKLYSDSLGNTQVGSSFVTNAIGVTNGLFITAIDFGAGIFAGNSRWLEVDVKTNGGASYTALSPLQAVTPAPYAVMASSASNLLGTLPAAQLSAGTAGISISGNAATATSATSATTATTANNFSGWLAGDVTGTQSATVVSTVGGQTAANVAGGVSAANSATSANIGNTIVKRDSGGNFSSTSLTLGGALYFGSAQVHCYGGGSYDGGNSGNFFAGFYSGNFYMSGSFDTGVGMYTLWDNGTGYRNAAFGTWALEQNSSGSFNTAIGAQALYYNTVGTNNTALGHGAGMSLVAGNNNIEIGNVGASSDNGVIRIGTPGTHTATYLAGAIYANSTVSAANTIYADAGAVNTGTLNPGLIFGGTGSAEGISSKRTSGTDQYGLDFYTANTIRMTVNNSGNVGIGTTSPGSKLVVQADDTSSYADAKQVIIQGNTDPNQQLELGYKTTGNYSVIQSIQQNSGYTSLALQPEGGKVGIGTTSPGYLLAVGGSGSPAYCNGTSWVNGSDRNSKEAFTSINPRDVLEKVSALPITEWKYKTEADGDRHIGPMAQDFHAAFGLNGPDDKHISTVDESGVALAAIQGLNEKVESGKRKADTEIEELKAENAGLKAQLERLEQRLNARDGGGK